jgi:hypothetical protein
MVRVEMWACYIGKVTKNRERAEEMILHPITSVLKMEAACSSERSVSTCETAQCHTREHRSGELCQAETARGASARGGGSAGGVGVVSIGPTAGGPLSSWRALCSPRRTPTRRLSQTNPIHALTSYLCKSVEENSALETNGRNGPPLCNPEIY